METHIMTVDVPIRHKGSTCQGIIVDDDCWIGSNVAFLDGPHVASCYVVKGYTLPNSIAVDMPARVIKSRGPVAQMKSDEMSEIKMLSKAPRIGIDFHVVDGIFQGSRTFVLELFSEVIRISSDIHFMLFLENTDLIRTFSAANVGLVHKPLL